MSVKITGLNKLLNELEKRLGKAKVDEIAANALSKGAEIVKKEVDSSIGTSGKYAKGWTVEDTSIKSPDGSGTKKAIIHWNGAHGRYRIIHLNEWGTVKNPSPPRKGAIARALESSKKPYRAELKKGIKEGI